MRRSLRRELRFLRLYVIGSTILLGALAFAPQGQKARFTELDVERINIVEPDGALRMVIANRPRSIGPIYQGKPFGYPGGTRPGIIFFNDEGTENGGLTMTGRRDSTGRYSASTSMSFDQYNQDQILTLQYVDQNGRRRTGISIGDRAEANIYDVVQARDSITAAFPDTSRRNPALRALMGPRNGVPMNANRVYLGRDVMKAAVLDLSDPQGRPRLRLRVDSLGAASLEFLNEAGAVTSRIPGASR